MKNTKAFRAALEVLTTSSLSGNGKLFLDAVAELLAERDVLLAAVKKVLAEEDKGFLLNPSTTDALHSIIANAEAP